ncbi:MAG: XTP/dITP diphosphatase [Nitrospirae bacterium]|nr:XTP/dITP diphosphatase [Nitrospirota bacterium]
MELVIATRNRKKVGEIRRILEGIPVTLHTLDDFPGCPEVEEDEATFEGNAIKKARAVAGYSGKPSLADDSGLEVDALGGAPGVFSARYAGEGADDRKNLEKLLSELRDVGKEKREARFICVIALALPDGKVDTFRGSVAGRIGTEPRGESGFGYDPVFYPEGHERTFAEMSADEKDALSHRAIALRELRRYFATLMND